MYKNTNKDSVFAVVTAALGAGSAAYISVSQGQNVFVGLGVTAIATVMALVIDRLLFRQY